MFSWLKQKWGSIEVNKGEEKIAPSPPLWGRGQDNGEIDPLHPITVSDKAYPFENFTARN
jgi:hypothetical protein